MNRPIDVDYLAHHFPDQDRCDYEISPRSSNVNHSGRIKALHSEDSNLKIHPTHAGNDGCDCDARDMPATTSGSPLSVIEIYHQEEFLTKSPPPAPEVNKLQLTRRGIDSPVKVVDTRNVYVSAITKQKSIGNATCNSGLSSSFSSSASSSLELATFLEHLPYDDVNPTKANAKRAPAPTPSPQMPPLVALTKNLTPANLTQACHRRQNTSDSTHSKVAAVARGASKAAAEASDDPEIQVDKPVSKPRRQQTAGSDAFPDITSDSCGNRLPKSGQTLTAGRIPRRRPPRHDTRQANMTSTSSIQRMKKSVSAKKQQLQDANPNTGSPMDRPVPCPMRQLTAEKSLPPERDICVTPKSLLQKFDLQRTRQSSADSQDYDTSSFDHEGEAYFTSPTPYPTLHTATSSATIQAWLNMPQAPAEITTNRWTNSEPILKIPSDLMVAAPATPKPHYLGREDEASERTFEDGSVLLNTPTVPYPAAPAPAELVQDEDTTANDTSCDNRMFQAFLNMPPRRCTTPMVPLDTTVPLYTVTTPTSNAGSPQWIAAAPGMDCFRDCSTSGIGPHHDSYHTTTIHTDLCLDVSAIEMSIDLSLPSFFSDCRGHTIPPSSKSSGGTKPGNSDTGSSSHPLQEGSLSSSRLSLSTPPLPRDAAGCQPTQEGSLSSRMSLSTPPLPRDAGGFNGGSSIGSLNFAEMAAKADLQRRMSLPPPMPHRRKPSLHVDDDEEENKAIQALWSSMPVLGHNSKPEETTTTKISGDLRSAWPRMRLNTAPPSMPNRHRRQDSLLSTEADCDTMVPLRTNETTTENKKKNVTPLPLPPTSCSRNLSPTRRASMPPLQPHRRKPSLLLEDITVSPAEEEKQAHNSQDYNATQHNLWASLPAVLARSPERRSTLPPAMPHRRKPSLNILEDGQEGMIEMWLTPRNSNLKKSPRQAVSKPQHRRQDSFSSVGTYVLKEGEAEI